MLAPRFSIYNQKDLRCFTGNRTLSAPSDVQRFAFEENIRCIRIKLEGQGGCAAAPELAVIIAPIYRQSSLSPIKIQPRLNFRLLRCRA